MRVSNRIIPPSECRTWRPRRRPPGRRRARRAAPFSTSVIYISYYWYKYISTSVFTISAFVQVYLLLVQV